MSVTVGLIMGRVKSWAMDRAEKAAERGSMDRYYGRRPDPHFWLDNLGKDVVKKSDMSEYEIDAYYEGWSNEEDRKDWGYE